MLADHLHCPLCKSTLSTPITLRCGHAICSHHTRCTLHNPPVSASNVQTDVSLSKILGLLTKYPDDKDEDDLLSHLKKYSEWEKDIPPDQPVLPPDGTADGFEKELVTELTCEICFSILYEPTTTPCGHTFCARCLHRSLDHGTSCPLCRQQLPGFAYFQHHPPNNTILRILLDFCPTAYNERGAAIEAEERDARLDTPIFVCQLSFPALPVPAFGMIMSSSSSNTSNSSSTLNPQGQVEYGTMLEIRSVQMLADGRSMVETWGVWRFRILERGLMDGYIVGRVERIDDIDDELLDDEDFEIQEDDSMPASASPPATPPSSSSATDPPSQPPSRPRSHSHPPIQPARSSIVPLTVTSSSRTPRPQRPLPLSTSALVAHCTTFLSQLHTNTTPWVVQRLSYTHGPPPNPTSDPGNFSFYVGMVLPIDEWEKAKLLPVRSVRMRLKMCVWWIEGLRRNWWFERGCVVL
uniref:RING-type domain-containing protein n=1 Tax=Moniliophthora roreri TaxID=221103 RepID=A0A0W0FJX1_MONRR